MGQLVEVTLEIDAELKEQAEKVLAENGLTFLKRLSAWKNSLLSLTRL